MKWDENINWDDSNLIKYDSRNWENIQAKNNDQMIIPLSLDSFNIPEGFIKQFLILTSLTTLVSSAVNGEIPGITLIIWWNNFYILHWTVKETWGGKKYKLPKLPKGYRNSYKPLGIMYKRVLRICQELHTLGLFNEHEAIFFRKVFTEGRLLGQVHTPSGGKYELYKLLRQENQLLRSSSCCSVPQSIDKTEFPYTHRFLELSLKLAFNSEPFRKEYFMPFLSSRSKALDQINSPQSVYLKRKIVDDKEIYFTKIRQGRGGLIPIANKSLN